LSIFDFPKAEPTVSKNPDDLARAHRNTVGVLNSVLTGKLNALKEVTLNVSATSTTVTDSRVTVNSFLAFDPVTANAATELANGTLYALSANRRNGEVTLTHVSNGQTDRTYKILVIG
jgi:hypothetical protein